MVNLDVRQQETAALFNKMQTAFQKDDNDAFLAAMTEFADGIQQRIIEEQRAFADVTDVTILAQRGIRQLTREEKDFYNSTINALKSSNPRQALADADLVLPKTVISDVFKDLRTQHELLDAIDFQNTGGVVEWLMNTNPMQMATWSPLCAEIVKELTSGFKKIDLTLGKLSAFLLVCKAMLDLGPEWLDLYVRTVLLESLAFGLEWGIICGRGTNQTLHEPIGARKNIAGAIDPANGYPDKTPVVLNSLTPADYGAILGELADAGNGMYRIFKEVLLVVNPKDYRTKVEPATTVMTANATYAYNVFPSPTKVVQSAILEEGRAIIGIADRYFMALGTGKAGKIEYSDDYKFLEDERAYLIKLYGYGQPKDNTSFILLDVSNLEPYAQRVVVTNAADFPVA